jgi:hypothetical protein
MTILPSKAVDSVWQAWMVYDKSFPEEEDTSLIEFTKRNFANASRQVTYVPLQTSDQDTEEALVRTFVLNSIVNGIDFSAGTIPSLFRLDRMLKMPYGKFIYEQMFTFH